MDFNNGGKPNWISDNLVYEEVYEFIPSSGLFPGIDVSIWQSSRDGSVRMSWEKAKALIYFAFIKATEGTAVTDREYNYNRLECDRLNIVWGPYHFFKGDKNPILQAEHFASTIGYWDTGYRFDPKCYHYYGKLPPVFDVEARSKPLWVTKNAFGSNLEKFYRRFVEITGFDLDHLYSPMIYTNSVFDTIMPLTNWAWRLRLWVAHWRTNNPYIPREWANHGKDDTFHQYDAEPNTAGPKYGSGGTLAIDLDRYRGTLEEFNTEFHTSVVPPSPPEPPIGDYMKVKCLGSSLRVRNAPNTTAATVEYLRLDNVTEALQEYTDSAGNIWIRVGWKQWSAMKYAGVTYLVYV